MQKLSAASRSALASARQDLLQFFSPVDDDAQLAAGGAAPQHDQAAFWTNQVRKSPLTPSQLSLSSYSSYAFTVRRLHTVSNCP